jgi:hypothetical protein
MVKRKINLRKIVGVAVVFLILIALIVGVAFFFFGMSDNGDFEVDRLFIRTILKESGGAETDISINNKNTGFQDFSINVNEVRNLVVIKEREFSLGYEEEKHVMIEFNAVNGTTPGIYLGNIEIKSNGNTKKIPITVEVQSEEVLFSPSVTLIPQGKDLIPGQKLNAEIKIFNLQDFGRTTVELTYFIKDFEGRTITSESEEKIVEGSSIGFSVTLELPSNLRLGDYSFGIITEYEGSVGTLSRTFKVVESIEGNQAGFDSKTLLVVVVVFGFFFLVFLVLLIYSIFYRDKLLVELQNQYKGELRRQKKLIGDKKTEDYSKLSTAGEKKEYLKEINEIKRLRFLSLKQTKKKKEVELKQIKKSYKGSSLKAQLEKWKKKGYDTGVLETKYKLPNVKSIKAKVNMWKKKGYDTSILEKNKFSF